MGMADAAERSITRGLGLTTDAAARTVFHDLREQGRRLRERQASRRQLSEAEAEAERKASMCFTHLLTSDIIYLVAKAGMATDPDFALRMAGVCTDWRETILAHGQLWGHLRLSRRRPVAKATLWIERSRGRLRAVEMTERVPTSEHKALAEILGPHIAGVEDVHFHYLLSDDYKAWRGKCRALKSFKVRIDPRALQFNMLRILHPDAKPNRIEFMSLQPREMLQPTTPSVLGLNLETGDPVSATQLASLRHLKLNVTQIMAPEPWLPKIAESASHLESIEVQGRTLALKDVDFDPITLPNLRRLEVCDAMGMAAPSSTLLCPNLLHYSCWKWNAVTDYMQPGAQSHRLPVLQNLRGPGIPLATLTSLDLGHCAFAQADLLALLPQLKALRFLNVSFTGIDNDFLEALSDRDNPALPSLTALSVAGHDTLSAGPLRRLVLNRLGIGLNRPKKAAPPPKRSAFAPAKRAQPAPSSLPAPTTSSTASDPAPSTAPPSLSAVAPITWICVDQCNHPDMSVDILAQLRRHARFLSNQNGAIVEDRVRGRGAYAWDADDDWTAACGGGVDGCHLRKRRADEDGWYVHHTCKRARAGEGDVDGEE